MGALGSRGWMPPRNPLIFSAVGPPQIQLHPLITCWVPSAHPHMGITPHSGGHWDEIAELGGFPVFTAVFTFAGLFFVHLEMCQRSTLTR